MRYAVLSDIHGNLTAFEAVLADIDREGVDAVLSLGDNIGYGPDSEAVVSLLRERDIPSTLGNHELAAIDDTYLGWFNPVARRSLEQILTTLSPGTLTYIRSQPRFLVRPGFRCVHGFPPDSPTRYLFQVGKEELAAWMRTAVEEICFVGHTHELRQVTCAAEGIHRAALSAGETRLAPDCRYILNIGAVGQPRDGNPNAKYVIWEPLRRRLDVRFVPYDIQPVADRILAQGLPAANARRLFG